MIIKCPECGHQISDKAPTCPSCGVEVAGKITRCEDCGEVYFKDETVCPRCHCPNPTHTHQSQAQPIQEEYVPETHEPSSVTQAEKVVAVGAGAASVKPSNVQATQAHQAPVKRKASDTPDSHDKANTPKKKAGKTTLIISIVIALLICGITFYMYKQAEDQRELKEYEIAMNSNEPLILQQYIDTFRDSAPKEHLDSIEAHLLAIKNNDDDWQNALKSGTKSALQDFLKAHPNTPHRATAMNKIDSIDWAQTSSLKTEQAYKDYMTEHPDGAYYADAEDAIRKLKVNEVTESERSTLANVLHNFFVSINSRDAATLVTSVANDMTLLDKQNASEADVLEMMNKQYRDGVSSITWRLPGSYDIKKREIGNERYEYTTSFTARKDVDGTDGPHTKRFRVTAKVNPNGKISYLKMSEITDEPKPASDEQKAQDKPKQAEKPKASTSDKPKPSSSDKPSE